MMTDTEGTYHPWSPPTPLDTSSARNLATREIMKMHIWKVMGAKGFLRIAEGSAIKLVMYHMVNCDYIGNDGKTLVTEDQVEVCEDKKDEFDHHNYLTHHVICQSVSPWLGSLILNLESMKEMWEKVKSNLTKKSTLHLIDAKEQLSAMCCPDSSNLATHINEMKAHLELMDKQLTNLIAIRSKWDDNKISQLMLGSLPESYWLIISTISIQREDSKKLPSPTSITKIVLNEANHQLILAECTNSGSVMYVKQNLNKAKSKKTKFNGECYKCGQKGHKKHDCPKEEEDKSEQKSSNEDKRDKGKKTESICYVRSLPQASTTTKGRTRSGVQLTEYEVDIKPREYSSKLGFYICKRGAVRWMILMRI
jgi:hypothetical protein